MSSTYLQPTAHGHICKLCVVKITYEFRWLGAPLAVIFLREAREPAHSDKYGPLA